MKPTMKAPGIQLLKLKYGKPFSNFGFKFNLHRYNEGATAEAGPWMFTLDAPSYMAVRAHAKVGGLFTTSTRPTFESTTWVLGQHLCMSIHGKSCFDLGSSSCYPCPSCKDRALREKMYRSYLARASEHAVGAAAAEDGAGVKAGAYTRPLLS